jgi:hypothetical protein
MSAHTKQHLMYWLIQAGPEVVNFLITMLRLWHNRPQ